MTLNFADPTVFYVLDPRLLARRVNEVGGQNAMQRTSQTPAGSPGR